MPKIIIILSLFFHLSGLAVFDEDQVDVSSPGTELGHGSFGRANLSSYGTPSSLIVTKFLDYSLQSSLENALNDPTWQKDKLGVLQKELKRITPDICLNHEFFGSPFITSTLGIYVSADKDKTVVSALEPMLGGSLAHYLEYIFENNAKLDIKWLKYSFARIAFAINELHQKGWIWRDASLKNIFIDFDTGLVKASDFDIAKRMGDNSDSGKPEDDWNDFGSRILSNALHFIKGIDSFNQSEDALGLNEAKNLLSGPDLNTPGQVYNFEGFKKIPWFNDVDWEEVKNNTDTPTSFIPKNDPAYLEFIYSGKPELLNQSPFQQ